jgi:hypothetical protein
VGLLREAYAAPPTRGAPESTHLHRAGPHATGLTGRATLRAMDGLGQAVGNGISGLFAGAFGAIEAAVSGVVDALSTALPAGALPVIGIAVVVLVVVALIRR